MRELTAEHLSEAVMRVADDFQIEQGYASFRPVGKMSFEESAAACVEAIRVAGESGIRRLLIDLTGLVGFGSISTLDRFWLGKQCASAAKPGFKLAVVANPDMVDEQHFGVMAAKNRGLQANVFATEEEARVWLLSYQPH
jgi:hypothetical protein